MDICYHNLFTVQANVITLSWLNIWFASLMAVWAMLSGNASVLYTFYPPSKAHPLFYLGAALLIVGSWLPFFNWAGMYTQWKKVNSKFINFYIDQLQGSLLD